jgi:hypothetical protein
MCDSIKSTQTVKRVDQAGDETDDIAIPAGVVDPSFENKVAALVCWSTCHNSDENNQPANL